MKAKSNSPTIDNKNAESNQQVDVRITRALSEFLHAENGEHGDETYRVFSGSGRIYAVDLDGPNGMFCACEDPAAFCKHILYVLFVERPGFLLECEHGDEHCAGSQAIKFEDSEPVLNEYVCHTCFMNASQDEKMERDGTEPNERPTPIRSEPADFGYGESTGVQDL